MAKIDTAIEEISQGRSFDSLKAHDKLVIGYLCKLEDRLAGLLSNK